MTQPTPAPSPHAPGAYPPQPLTPPRKSHTGLIVALILGVVALVLVAGIGLAVLGASSSGGASPSDRAAEYIQAYHDNDSDKVLSLIAPAQQRLIDEDLWNECGYDRLDKSDDGTDPDDPDAQIETIAAEQEGIYTRNVPGDGEREYEAVSTVVRATSADGEFREFEVDMVKDGDNWYVRLSQQGIWSEFFSVREPCE